MTGWLTNGLQPVAAVVNNGVPTAVDSVIQNGTVISMGAAPPYTQLGAAALLPADTGSAGGQQPQSVAATAFQVAAHTAGLIANQGTSTAGAVSLSRVSGLITTEALTTAPGANYSFVLTNTLISAALPTTQVQMLDGTNTAGTMQINSITDGTGTCTIVFENVGSVALNGTKLIAFHI